MNCALSKTILRLMSCACVAAFALVLGACAALTRPADAGRPRANEPPKFAALSYSEERHNAALANWKAVLGEQAAAASPTPELQPVTATLRSMPANLSTQPRMPLVIISGEKAQTEEETRESLRRFITTAAPLLGTNLDELSLVEVVDSPIAAGAKTARYRQNAFQYPLRNGYGSVEITFTPDLRVVGLSSTAIPDASNLRRALAAVAQNLTNLNGEKAAASLANRAVTFNDSNGNRQTRNVTQADAVAARTLVVFPVRREAEQPTLELHLAWEVAVGGPDSPLLVYLDAVTGEQLGASQGA